MNHFFNYLRYQREKSVAETSLIVILILQSGNLVEKVNILTIPAALSIFISFSNCSTRSSMTFENLNLQGGRSKITW